MLNRRRVVALASLLILVVVPIGMANASSTPSGSDATVAPPGVYSPEEGIPGAPDGTCPADPDQRGCPDVTEVVVAPASSEEVTSYGPDVGAGNGRKGHVAARSTNGQVCGVTAAYPNVTANNNAHGHGENECEFGQGVESQQLWVQQDKYQADGNLQNRGTEYSGLRTGAGHIEVDNYANCNGRSAFNWRTFAYAYSVVNGIGYYGQNIKYRSIPCN